MNRELTKRQNDIIDELDLFPSWAEKFSHLIHEADSMPELPEAERVPELLIEGCISRTYFSAKIIDGKINISGWSNASVPQSLIYLCRRVFDGLCVSLLRDSEIVFHIESGLIYSLTPPRAAALQEMIRRVLSLLK